MNGTTKIIIAEDHCVLREGLRSLLQKQAHIEVVGEADNGRQAIQLAGELNPDVAVMGISMPELNGIDAARRIVDQYYGVKVIMLSMYHDRKLVIAALKAGASGYVLKNCSVEELINAINAAVRGHIYLSSQITELMVNDFINHEVDTSAFAFLTLSRREREVLQLIAEGKSSKEIAAQLDISIKTTDAHMQNIMRKLKIHSIAGLTKYAIRQGLTPPD